MSRRGQLKYKIVRKIRTSKADDYTVERFHHWDMAMAKILVNLESAICCERCEWVSKSAMSLVPHDLLQVYQRPVVMLLSSQAVIAPRPVSDLICGQ